MVLQLPPLSPAGSRPLSRSASRPLSRSGGSPKVQDPQQGTGAIQVYDHLSLPQLLAGLKVFKDLDHAVLSRIPGVVTAIRCPEGSVLFRQGDPPGNCYILSSGLVSINILSEEEALEQAKKGGTFSRFPTSTPLGEPINTKMLDLMPGKKTIDGFSRYHAETLFGSQVAQIGPGNVIGELALLNDQPRSASVQCSEDSEFLVIRRKDFDDILKEEMVRKGDEKLRFLIEHLPGLKEVPVPKPGSSKVHASYSFKRSKFPRGHSFLVQGQQAEPGIWVIFKGRVEYRRAETLVDKTDPPLVPRFALPERKNLRLIGLKKSFSQPRLIRLHRDGNLAFEANNANPNGVMSRRGVLVEGGVFGTLPIPGPEPFTIEVVSQMCEVFYVSGPELNRLPRKLLDTLQDYVASSTTWRLDYHKKSLNFRQSTNERQRRDSEEFDLPDPSQFGLTHLGTPKRSFSSSSGFSEGGLARNRSCDLLSSNGFTRKRPVN
jgi:CRP-like cAMP-binding protein